MKVNVNGISLAYLERGIGQPQGYLQPVYVYSCTAFFRGKSAGIPFTRYVAALAKPPEPLWPSGQDYKSDRRPKRLPRPELESEKMLDPQTPDPFPSLRLDND